MAIGTMTLSPEVVGRAVDESRPSKRLWWILAIGASGLLFDLFDQAIISYALPSIGKEFQLDAAQLGLVVSAGTFGLAIGAFGWGWIADRWGRRLAFGLTLLIFSLFTGAMALAPTVGVIVGIRFLAGLGLGGGAPIDQLLVTEFAPKKIRGRVSGSVQWIGVLGLLFAAALGLLIVPTYGWRLLFVVGLVPLVILVLLRRLVPESPRWLAAKGRYEEARSALAFLGIRQAELDAARAAVAATGEGASTPPGRVRDLFAPSHRLTTAWLWSVFFLAQFGAYGIFAFWPVIFSTVYGIPLQQTLTYTLIIAASSVVNRAIAVTLVDKVGRKPLMILGLFGMALTVWVFVAVQSIVAPATLLGIAVAFQFFLDQLVVSSFVYCYEAYPVAIRGTGASSAQGMGRVGAIISPLLVGGLIAARNITAMWLIAGLAFALAGVLVTVFARETRGTALETAPVEPQLITAAS